MFDYKPRKVKIVLFKILFGFAEDALGLEVTKELKDNMSNLHKRSMLIDRRRYNTSEFV